MPPDPCLSADGGCERSGVTARIRGPSARRATSHRVRCDGRHLTDYQTDYRALACGVCAVGDATCQWGAGSSWGDTTIVCLTPPGNGTVPVMISIQGVSSNVVFFTMNEKI